jgi:hypothetical protein
MVRATSPGRQWGRAERRFRQAAALLTRGPAAHAVLHDPRGVAGLLDSLTDAGAGKQLPAAEPGPELRESYLSATGRRSGAMICSLT